MFPHLGNTSLVICVSPPGKHISLVICVPPPGKHIPSDMCSASWETHIPSDMLLCQLTFFFPTISYNTSCKDPASVPYSVPVASHVEIHFPPLINLVGNTPLKHPEACHILFRLWHKHFNDNQANDATPQNWCFKTTLQWQKKVIGN